MRTRRLACLAEEVILGVVVPMTFHVESRKVAALEGPNGFEIAAELGNFGSGGPGELDSR